MACVYVGVNPEADQFWIIDCRICDPAGDGKTRVDPVTEMLRNCILSEDLAMRAVLMDTWYATKELLLQIERGDTAIIYYCPLKDNRLVQ